MRGVVAAVAATRPIEAGRMRPSIWRAWIGIVVGSLVAMGADGRSTKPQPPALIGLWGGNRVMLTLDDRGGKLESDCAFGTIAGAVHPGDDHRFKATGTFQADMSGPAAGDAAAPPARFEGQLHGDILLLSVHTRGKADPQHFTLHKDRRQKLIRCL